MPTIDRDTSRPYAFCRISRLNHWITAALFLGAFGLGLVMAYAGLPRESIGALLGWHKALGVTMFIYGVWRVGWRIHKGFPSAPINTPAWQATTSKVVHIALLGTILAMPISGIAMTIAGGRSLTIWGVALLPSLGEIGWLKIAAETLHEQAPLFIAALLAAHIGAALKHHFIDRDATLIRMTTGRDTRLVNN